MKANLLWALASLVLVSVLARFWLLAPHNAVPEEGGFSRAAGQPGYDEVKGLAGNPVGGDASVAESECFSSRITATGAMDLRTFSTEAKQPSAAWVLI